MHWIEPWHVYSKFHLKGTPRRQKEYHDVDILAVKRYISGQSDIKQWRNHLSIPDYKLCLAEQLFGKKLETCQRI